MVPVNARFYYGQFGFITVTIDRTAKLFQALRLSDQSINHVYFPLCKSYSGLPEKPIKVT